MDSNLEQILRLYEDSEVNFQVQTLSKKFINTYWLSDVELTEYWFPVKNNIFCSNSKDLPDLMFKKGFELIAQRGGILFTKEEYYALQNCMKIAGDKYFVLIENEFTRDVKGDFPHLRFKFPVDTTWEMLNNGDENFPDIAHEALFIMNKHFFVFGNSGKWGKYAASDYYNTPLDIIGFKSELAPVFYENFEQSQEEQEEIREWLPQEYKVLIK